MKKHLKLLLVLCLVVPCVMVFTACGAGKDMDAEAALGRFLSLMEEGTLEDIYMGWEGVVMKGSLAYVECYEDENDYEKLDISGKLDIKIINGEEPVDIIASVKSDSKMTASTKIYKQSDEAKTSAYVAGGTAYDNILKTKTTEYSMGQIYNALGSVGGVAFEAIGIESGLELKSAKRKELSGKREQITLAVDLEKQFADEGAESVKTSGKYVITMIFDEDGGLLEIKLCVNFKVTKSYLDGDYAWTESVSSKASVFMKEYKGKISEPSGISKYVDCMF